MDEKTEKSLREALAHLCHEQWSGWMDYLFSKAPFNADGTWTMPAEFVERWLRQSKAQYSDLSFNEQESDRKEANKFIALFLSTPESEPKLRFWRETLDERQLRLVRNCQIYASNDPAGVPAHNLMLLIAKMAEELDRRDGYGEV